MYAVIKSGGKQYRVSPGDEVVLEKLPQLEGEKVEFEEVLLVNRNGEIMVGKKLGGVKVVGTVLEQFKGEKIEVFKYKPKKRYRRKHGHRQLLTRVRIEEIEFPEKEKAKKKAKKGEKESKSLKKKKEVKKEKVEKRKKKENGEKEKKEEKAKRTVRSSAKKAKKEGKRELEEKKEKE